MLEVVTILQLLDIIRNGSLDSTFGTNGIVITPIGTFGDYARSVIIQNNGKIVTAGYYNDGSVDKIALARYNQDGSLDNTYGTNGIVTTSIRNFPLWS